jgi:oligopeptide/dipeptide ABC transporter ATP-binding protein
VIADEPTTGLDVTVQRQILDMFKALLEREHSAMLLVTHDLGVVAQYCDRVMVMYAGKIVEMGPVLEVFGRPAHAYTRALLGAIPRPGEELVTISGTVPDPIDYPEGCPFWARCQFRLDPRCETESPPLREVSEGHWVASFYDLPDEDPGEVGISGAR